MKVSEIMSKTLTIVEPEATLGEAATMMGERHVGSAVVCEDDRLVGILTERDIVRALSREHDAPQRAVHLYWHISSRACSRKVIGLSPAMRPC